MRGNSYLRVALVLVGLLAASYFVLSVARQERRTNPSATNSGPSGLAGLAELLRQQGYDVVIDRRERPRLRPQDVAIAVTIPQKLLGIFDQEPIPFQEPPFNKNLHAFLSEGGSVIHLVLPGDFADASTKARTVEAALLNDPEPRALSTVEVEGTSSLEVGESEPYVLWTAGEPLASGYLEGTGVAIQVENGIAATNRFLGREDNAEYIADLVSRVGRPGGRVVFTEASFGNIDREGFLGALGSWAVAAQWQLILLLGVVVFSLGARFGRPDPETTHQRGSRDMIDAVSETMRLSKKQDLAVRVLGQNTLDEARKLLGVPPGTSEQRILQSLPWEDRRLLQAALYEEGFSREAAVKVAGELTERSRTWTRTSLRERRRAEGDRMAR
ncbi:MAG: hypothetical protein KIT11_01050 [Fimbriimonadaceae bacterium]|nr:hypothetical protein [Fimbriimonadaceae bacterium]QYK55039.1 MAG: hypothetical protein KF733_08485 [Fimbriimonadaceae bacterium]